MLDLTRQTKASFQPLSKDTKAEIQLLPASLLGCTFYAGFSRHKLILEMIVVRLSQAIC